MLSHLPISAAKFRYCVIKTCFYVVTFDVLLKGFIRTHVYSINRKNRLFFVWLEII